MGGGNPLWAVSIRRGPALQCELRPLGDAVSVQSRYFTVLQAQQLCADGTGEDAAEVEVRIPASGPGTSGVYSAACLGLPKSSSGARFSIWKMTLSSVQA